MSGGWNLTGMIDGKRREIGRVGRNRTDFGWPQPGSASSISFFSWRNKEKRVLILPIRGKVAQKKN